MVPLDTMNKSFLKLAAISLAATLGVSCTTTYDQQGRAVKSVTPEGALIGVAAAGLIGYSISKNRHKKDNHYGYDNRGHGGRHYGNQGHHNQRSQRGHSGY